jgi:hypothetical protein
MSQPTLGQEKSRLAPSRTSKFRVPATWGEDLAGLPSFPLINRIGKGSRSAEECSGNTANVIGLHPRET